MALEETTQFLEDLFLRFDPDIDLTDGSRFESEVIQPILDRIGIDPFDQDIITFVTERVRQAFPDLAITDVDALTDTLIDPMRVLIEPLVREVKLVKLRASLRNVEAISDDEVDALMANFFEPRRSGGFATGTVRAFFSQPTSVTATIVNPAFASGGLRYFPTVPQQITADQMLLNISGTEYYWDINYTAERRGDEYNVEPNTITSISNFPSSTRIRNLRKFRDGAPREDSIAYVARVSEKLSDRTLTVIRGILSELFDNFPTLEKIQVIGFGDAEMERDIIRGGGMGTITDDGAAFGDDGTFTDDGDGDDTTQLFDTPTGSFISRIGTAGDDPGDVFLSIFYTDPTTLLFVTRDTQILEVISDTRVRIADEIPVGAVPTGLAGSPWALRQRVITISDIPGGITLPDRVDGTIEINDDEIHIGGKTDVYVGGAIDEETSQIDSLTDEDPLVRGVDARTGQDASLDIIYLPEHTAPLTDIPLLEVGMSFVLEEGVDIGSYLIREIIRTVGPELRVRLNVEMTGIQTNLVWKIIDDIDVELTEPKDIKVEGSDLVTVSGNPNVTTTGGTNFVDANVQSGDILRLVDELAGGDFEVTTVAPASLTLDPAPTRSIIGGLYSVFRLSEAMNPPLVRIKTLELLDSSGAPVGTVIPYRDPILAESTAFQNQGNEAIYEGPGRVGLVSIASFSGSFTVGGASMTFRFYDPEKPYAGELAGSPYVFSFGGAGARTLALMVDDINTDVTLQGFGVRSSEISYAGETYFGLFSQNLIRIDNNATTLTLYLTNGITGVEVSNAMLNSFSLASLGPAGVRTSDVVEFLTGENRGLARVIHAPYETIAPGSTFPHLGHVTLGNGPTGPRQTIGVTEALGKLYFNKPLIPEVGEQIRIGRPSIGSARAYYLDPTSAEFDFEDVVFTAVVGSAELRYVPDPENLRTVQPAPPLTALPSDGVLTATDLTDTAVDFLAQGIDEGDLLEILFNRLPGGALAAPPAFILVAGLTLIISLDDGPFITLSFPADVDRDGVVDYINEQLGQDVAFLDAGTLFFKADVKIEISSDSTSLVVLGIVGALTNIPFSAGEYIVASVAATVLTFSLDTPASGPTSNMQYRIRRYIQRISSTEMNDNVDETGLNFAEVELISEQPGNRFNIPAGFAFTFTGQRGDGFRLFTPSDVLSYSRAEILNAEISRTILLVGSSDSPEEYVQLSQQNVQVNYDRSQLVDDVQSFLDSDFNRVTTQEGIARHLLPNFVSTNWQYVGGDLEVTMRRALEEFLGDVDADEQLEVGDLLNELRRRGAVSIFSPDTDATSGRTAPLFVVVYHELDRTISGMIVRDFVSTSRTKRFIPDELALFRVSPRGVSF